jgi:hypothetical protein
VFYKEACILEFTNINVAVPYFLSIVLDQVQIFLPQMAQANEKLRKEMAVAPPGRFNIENIDGTLGKVIQMVTALFSFHSVRLSVYCVT